MDVKTSLEKVWNKVLKRKSNSKTFELLSKKLEARRHDLLREFEDKHQETLSWLNKKGIDVDEIVNRGTRGALASVAAGMMLLSTGITPDKTLSQLEKPEETLEHKIVGGVTSKEVVDQNLIAQLGPLLPSSNRPLTIEEEKKITEAISSITGIKVVAELDGNRLNTNYGRIGLEQHLPRYFGETIADHFASESGWNAYGKSGMTKNKGAFGYFASSKETLTAEAIEKEKYYAVVQTFASPGWGQKPGLVEWYKHRKVLIVNPQNGKSVVADIADSGPAKFTGKTFGASPEAMDSMGIYFGNYKHPVLLFFIDETGGSPKLGPI